MKGGDEMNLIQVKGALPTSTKSANEPLAVGLKTLLENMAKADGAEVTTFEVKNGVAKISFSTDAAADKATTQLRNQDGVEVTALNALAELLEKTKKAQERADKMRERMKARRQKSE